MDGGGQPVGLGVTTGLGVTVTGGEGNEGGTGGGWLSGPHSSILEPSLTWVVGFKLTSTSLCTGVWRS